MTGHNSFQDADRHGQGRAWATAPWLQLHTSVPAGVPHWATVPASAEVQCQCLGRLTTQQWNYYYFIDRRIYLNHSESTQEHHRAESFETCCQWVLVNVQIITLLFTFTVQKYIYPPVSKVHAGSFRVSVIHQTLTWITRCLTCVCDHSYVCI